VSRPLAPALAALLVIGTAVQSSPPPRGDVTAAPLIAEAYDTILDADFAALPAQLAEVCGPAPREVCRMLDALGLWWQIVLEPETRARDAAFERLVDEAIAAASGWTHREPERAEAWFYLGAAYGTRVQFRVLREQRLSAARDGKHIKESLERALALDPSIHDAAFGLGLYRYYADIGPGILKILRWLLLLPAGDRQGGLQQVIDARERGLLVRDEADYQLHLMYLWYEHRAADALTIVRGLQARHPQNPLFWQLEGEILDVYFHDHAASLAAATDLLSRSASGRVHEAALASVRARMQMAIEHNHLGQRSRAIELLQTIAAEHPTRPHNSAARAESLLHSLNAPKR
jgi:hypothetical protein